MDHRDTFSTHFCSDCYYFLLLFSNFLIMILIIIALSKKNLISMTKTGRDSIEQMISNINLKPLRQECQQKKTTISNEIIEPQILELFIFVSLVVCSIMMQYLITGINFENYQHNYKTTLWTNRLNRQNNCSHEAPEETALTSWTTSRRLLY